MYGIFRTLLAVVVAIGVCAPVRAGEFQYSPPPGWWDLLAPGASERDTGKFPKGLLADAASGRFAAYGVDPASLTEGSLGATFNAVEQPGSVVITLDEVNKAGAEIVGGLNAKGMRAVVDEYSVFKLNGVPVGVMTIDLRGGASSRVIRQYLIPGKKTAVVLTYAAPRYEFASYLPAFEASARATKGAYDHSGYGWKRGAIAGGIAGLASAVVYIVLQLIRKRRDAAALADGGDGGGAGAMPTAAPAKKASKYVWNCPACGNPVPARLDQCRCGAAKPG